MARVLLLGSTDLTACVGAAILQAGADIAAVVSVGSSFSISYSERPVTNFRGESLGPWISEAGLRQLHFDKYDLEWLVLDGHSVDACIVAGWYHMVPAWFRDAFPCGCFGLHASLLPKLRGGAPLNWAILLGMEETGVSLFELGGGVDDGLILGQERLPIGPEMMIADLVEASKVASAALIRRHLPRILGDGARGVPQTGTPSYALQRIPDDGRIDWSVAAEEIHRLVRAVSHPYPGAGCRLDGREIKIWRSTIAPADIPVYGAPGQLAVLREFGTPAVVTGQGLLLIREATFDNGEDALRTLGRSSQRRFDRAAFA